MFAFDISGLSPKEEGTKDRIRFRITRLCDAVFDASKPLPAIVEFMYDETADHGLLSPVVARFYYTKLEEKQQARFQRICEGIVQILEEEAGHARHAVIPIPVLTCVDRMNPCLSR